MDTAHVLDHFGASKELLDPETVRQLDEDGYAVLPDFLDAQQLEKFRARLGELIIEGDKRFGPGALEPGVDLVPDLVNSDEMFDICYTHPLLLAAVSHVLPDFTISLLSGRNPGSKQGLQGLHADWHGEPPAPDDPQVFNSIYLLDDFTAENGATRVVPGSHLWGKAPADLMENPEDAHPDQKLVTAPAGSLVVFNGHLWHGGTQNLTDGPRRALYAYFTRRNNDQKINQASIAQPATLERLSPEAAFILGV